MLATTYGVGELSALNGVMGAKAEQSLVFHIVGMPSYQHQRLGKIACLSEPGHHSPRSSHLLARTSLRKVAFFGNQRSVKWLIHLFQFAPLKSGIATSIWRQEGYMAPKPKPARLVFAVGMVLAMALTILAVMTDRDWAAPSSSSPIYHPQLPLLY
jgi:hypothetical protein